jgi:hypothetical protein
LPSIGVPFSREVNSAAIPAGGVARPAILPGARDHSGINGIPVHVTHGFEEICIRVDERRVVAILEQVARGRDVLLKRSGVFRCDLLHQSTERRSADLDHQVQMVGHPAIRMHPRPKFFERARDDLVQQRSFAVVAENGLAMIATKSDVIDPAWDVNAKRARHTRTFARRAGASEARIYGERKVIPVSPL